MNAKVEQETLAERIKRLMNEAGLNQTTLAKKTGVDRSEINRIVTGKRPPRNNELAWVSGAFGMTVDELLDGVELPEQLRKAVDYGQEQVRRIYAAEGARDEARAAAKALKEELDELRETHAKQQAVLRQQMATEREAATKLIKKVEVEKAALKVAVNTLTSQLGALREELESDKLVARFEVEREKRRADTLQSQVTDLQERVSKANGEKVAIGIASSLGTLFASSLMRGGRRDDDDDDDDDYEYS